MYVCMYVSLGRQAKQSNYKSNYSQAAQHNTTQQRSASTPLRTTIPVVLHNYYTTTTLVGYVVVVVQCLLDEDARHIGTRDANTVRNARRTE